MKRVGSHSRGYQFERAVRADMQGRGWMAVRAAGSRTPADVYCLDAERKVFIQCKVGGRVDTDEWNAFYRYCRSVRAMPVVAMRGRNGRGITYKLITSEKEPHERKRWVDWVPTEGERDEVSGAEGRRDRVSHRHDR